MKLKDYAQTYQYLQSDEWSEATKQTYADHLRINILPILGDLDLEDISIEEMGLLRKTLIEKGLSPSRIKLSIGLLHRVLQYAFAAKRRSLPAPDLKLLAISKKQREKPAIEPFTLEEVARIIEACPLQYKAIFTVWAWTGARPSELAALTWSDVDLERGSITICKGLVKGKWAGSTKTGNARLVPLVSGALAIMRSLPQRDGLVFTTGTGHPIDHNLATIFKHACKRAGVKHRRSYMLRHTFASNALAAGASMMFVSGTLGHANIRTTMEHYARFLKDDKANRAEFDKIERLANG